MRRWPAPPPPESNAYLIIGIAGTLLGIATLWGSVYPSKYVQEHPAAYRNPSLFGGLVWLIFGLAFLIPAIRRKMK
jgi:hypothetical protein